MRPRQKPGQNRLASAERGNAMLDQVLAACARLPGNDVRGLRDHFSETARKVFHTNIAGLMVSDHGVSDMESIAPGAREEAGHANLLPHIQSFAVQAIESKRPLNFHFSYRDGEGDRLYYGLASPVLTQHSTAALLAVRKADFPAPDVSVFRALAGFCRLALENAELTGLYTGQQQNANDLLEVSSHLGISGRLEDFVPQFAMRTAEFLGYSSAFVALIDAAECHIRWGAKEGKAGSADFDISALSRKILESGQPFLVEDAGQLPLTENTQLLRWSPKMKQFLGMALSGSDGTVLGILGLCDKKNSGRINEDDVRRARAVAAEMAT